MVAAFYFTGAEQTWTVPEGQTLMSFHIKGASGYGERGANGGMVIGTIPVTPGEILRINIGGHGTITAGGWNGGGDPGLSTQTSFSFAPAKGGQGASDIRRGPLLTDRIVVAGGGGGDGAGTQSPENTFTYGGRVVEPGGEVVFASIVNGGPLVNTTFGGRGASMSAGGAGGIPSGAGGTGSIPGNAGTLGTGGAGGGGIAAGGGLVLGGGGGGGGYYGGGGGGAVRFGPSGGGGAGTSFVIGTATNVVFYFDDFGFTHGFALLDTTSHDAAVSGGWRIGTI